MSAHQFFVQSGKHSATVEIAEAGDRAAVAFGSHKEETSPARLGTSVWNAMRSGGIKPQDVNNFAIVERGGEGKLVATAHPVLEGAHAVWLVLYRANRDSSCFRPLPSKHRLGDALDAAFVELTKEIIRPHKP